MYKLFCLQFMALSHEEKLQYLITLYNQNDSRHKQG